MPHSGSTLGSATSRFRWWAARARHRVRSFTGQYPALYFPYARWKRRRHLRESRQSGSEPERKGPVQRDTEVVIEGFPRSANTFATTAFGLAQPNFVRVARHLHVPAQVIAATKSGIPTIVLIRDPEEAVLSLAVWYPYITIENWLKDYVRFYHRILPYREGFVIAEFGDVSNDFGAIIKRLNSRFGTSFREFEHTPDNVARCFEIIERHSLEKTGEVAERKIARPSEERESMKNQFRKAFHSPDLARLRAEAYGLYKTLTSS
jgi:hypothetical protein